MPMNKETHKQIPTRVTFETYDKFKEIADKYHQSLSARIAYLIDKDIEEYEKSKER
jgi:hypothetical protein